MKLTKEDYASYKQQQESNLKINKMAVWANEIVLKALEKVAKVKKYAKS